MRASKNRPSCYPRVFKLLVWCVVPTLSLVGCAGGGSSGASAEGAAEAPSTTDQRGPSGTNLASTQQQRLSRSELRERAIAELIEASRSSNAQLRANAVEGLAITPARLGPVLGVALRDRNEGVRTVAAVVAGDHRQRDQMGALRSMLSDSSPYARSAAIYALTAMNDRSVDISPLGDMATRSSSPRVRAHAVSLLGKMGDATAVPVVRSAAAERIPRAGEGEIRLLRLTCSEALVRLGEDDEIFSLHAALFPSSPDQLESAAVAAQMLGELNSRRSIPELTNLVVYRDGSTGQRMPAEIRLAAARSLGQLGKTDGAFVAMEYVNDPNPLVRAQASRVLSVMRGEDAASQLQRLLDDPNPAVRVAAAAGVLESLGR